MRNIECKLLHPEYGQAVPIPHYATEGSAAIDLPAMIDASITIPPGSVRLIKTGLAVNTMDSDLAMILLPRSGLGHENGIVLGNLIGLIDSDYQGEVMVSVWNRSSEPFVISPGDRIAQAAFVPVVRVNLMPVESFTTNTRRADGGFGSTGMKAHIQHHPV